LDTGKGSKGKKISCKAAFYVGKEKIAFVVKGLPVVIHINIWEEVR